MEVFTFSSKPKIKFGVYLLYYIRVFERQIGSDKYFMARELDALLDHGEANHAQSCVCADDSVSFLTKVIEPIYAALSKEAECNNNGKAAHSNGRNYDDFNEYFWAG